MADGKSNELNTSGVPYDENLPDNLAQPSTLAELSASRNSHPSASIPNQTPNADKLPKAETTVVKPAPVAQDNVVPFPVRNTK